MKHLAKAITMAIGCAVTVSGINADSQEPKNKFSLEYIGDISFETGHQFAGTEVGGLSGIDYDCDNDFYYAISDDREFPRFYQLTIDLSDGWLNDGDVAFTAVQTIYDVDGSEFIPYSVDPESIRLQPFPGVLYWTSEGDADAGISPFVRAMSRTGEYLGEFDLPEKYIPMTDSGIRNNLAFESLTFDFKFKKAITATENALIQDGDAATTANGSPSRVMMMNMKDGSARAEFIYMTDPVAAEPIPADSFSTNGLVELLSINKYAMIAVERSFSVGVGNTIKLYKTTFKGATNVHGQDSINSDAVKTMKKELLLNLDELGIVQDNIEGITFGPTLEDGSKTLILVSDNNFNPDGQFTQFIAFKLISE